MKGSTFKRCGCKDEAGQQLGDRCAKLRGSKHGSWFYSLDLPPRPDGKRHRVRRGGFETQRDAQAALDRVRSRFADGLDVTERPMTVGVFLDEWLAGKRRLRPNTVRSYAGYIDQYLRPHLGDVPLDRLRGAHISAMFDAIAAGNAGRERPAGPVTLHRIHATLRAALNAAVKQRRLAVNPATHVELPEAKRPTVTVWLPEQVGAFLDSVVDDRLATLYHLVIAVGLRRGEVCGLRWVDVDLDAGHLRVAQALVSVGGRLEIGAPKTDRGVRVAALDADTVELLRAHRRQQLADRLRWGEAWQDTGLVFTRENGAWLDPTSVTRRFQRLAASAGLPVIRFHDLRHTSASLGLAAGESMKEVSDRLGHSSITITADTYTHVAPAVARESAFRRAALIPRVTPLHAAGPTTAPSAAPETAGGAP